MTETLLCLACLGEAVILGGLAITAAAFLRRHDKWWWSFPLALGLWAIFAVCLLTLD